MALSVRLPLFGRTLRRTRLLLQQAPLSSIHLVLPHVALPVRRSTSPQRQLSCSTRGEVVADVAAPAPPSASPSPSPSSSTPSPSSSAPSSSSSASGYKQPPPEILQVVDTPPHPSLSFSPDRSLILQLDRPPSLPPLSEIAHPEMKLAGLRVDADLYARSRMSYYTGMSLVASTELVPAAEGISRRITGYPPGSWLNYVSWSPKGSKVAFTVRTPGGPDDPPREPLELWVADVATATSRRLLRSPEQGINAVFEDYTWLDEDTIVACVVPEGQGPPPQPPPLPPGPKIQDNSGGRKVQNRTYTDLLTNEHDERLLEHYGGSQIVLVDVVGGTATTIAPTRLYTEVDVSPNEQFLLVSWLERPFSFNVPCGRFPKRVQLWDRTGALIREMAYLPLAEDIPVTFNSTRKGPRAISWRSDQPAELYWVEAQDGGDAALEVSPRDIVYTLSAEAAASEAEPKVLAETDLRCGGVSWCDGDLAILYESWWKTRRSVSWTLSPDRPEEGKKLLFDRNYEDVYTDPGSPVGRRTSMGTYILAKIDGKRQLLMQGSGASPEGNRPFLDLLDLDTKESRRLWQSSPPFLESSGSLMCDNNDDAPISLDGLSLIISRETPKDPPQSFILTFGPDGSKPTERQLTDYPHPYPQLRDMTKEIIRYERDDGVALTATLYLPPGYSKEKDGPLPCIMWAYPREYKSKEAAGQMRRSPYQFSGIDTSGPTLWLARGYAVLDGPGFPIIAEGEEEPNDTYVEQLTACARAAVKELKERGVVDPARISVGGHSYGAFMAANLLAHAPDLFAAGIARSGAYNRTLTPFGFQSEERTIWQAPETYQKMSPFMNADKLKKPILLVHGEEDNNTGTFPLQSERFYSALKGQGAVCRFVLLPHESHGYRARESVLHMLYEMDQWLERYAGYGRVEPEYLAATSEDSDS